MHSRRQRSPTGMEEGMSAEATRTLIERYFSAFNAGDWDGMAALVDDDVAHDINQSGREVGRAAFRRFLGMMDVHYDETLGDIEIMVSPSGNRAAAEFTVRGVYKQTADRLPKADGQRYRLPAGIFFDIDDGRISRITTYYNLKDWVAQVENG